MRVAITGASGLVGTALTRSLQQRNHPPLRLVRRATSGDPHSIPWDPGNNQLDLTALENLDAVIHLAGEPVAAGRWTPERKHTILHSREHGTHFLAAQLARLKHPPAVLICASAIGYYGHRGDEFLYETSPPGTGFLAEVCQRWEAACAPARDAGIRVINLRLGVVLSPNGGALAKMLTPFRLGLGGTLGDGRAYMAWITLDDLIAAIHHGLTHAELSGPVNAVAPNPLTNREFTQALACALHRPAFFPAPAILLRAALGEMADELLLSSARALPKKLLETGFQFQHPTLESAFNTLLKK